MSTNCPIVSTPVGDVPELIKDIDGGNIIHQSVADLKIDDGIHQNACRVVKNFSDKLPVLLNKKMDQKKHIYKKTTFFR